MDASTLIDLALYLLGVTTPAGPVASVGTDPERGTKPIGG